MFSRKSNITKQNKMRDELSDKINLVLFGLEKGGFNKHLDKQEVEPLLKKLRSAHTKLGNSVGTDSTDIRVGVDKVIARLEELKQASADSLLGRFEDAVDDVILCIDEIIELEKGFISEITEEIDESTRKQRLLKRRLERVNQIERKLVDNKNRAEEEIIKLERDKKELDESFRKETNVRRQKNLFNSIKSTKNKIDMLATKVNQYSTCSDLVNTIKTYVNEIAEAGDLGGVDLDRAGAMLNEKRLQNVLTEPKELQGILSVIAKDLKGVKDAIGSINVRDPFTGLDEDEISQEMREYQDKLEKERFEEQKVKESTEGLGKNIGQTNQD